MNMSLVERVIRYGFAGVGVSLCYTGLVILLVEHMHGLGPVGAAMAGFVAVQPIGLLMHGTLTYPGSLRSRVHLPRIGARFLVTNGIGFCVSTGGMLLVTHGLHLSYLWGIALSWGAVPFMNFIVYLVWVFRAPPSMQEGS